MQVVSALNFCLPAYCDGHRRELCRRYLRSWLFIDLISLLPLGKMHVELWADLVFYASCYCMIGTCPDLIINSSGSINGIFKLARATRLLRLLRLVKLLKCELDYVITQSSPTSTGIIVPVLVLFSFSTEWRHLLTFAIKSRTSVWYQLASLASSNYCSSLCFWSTF